MKRCINHKLIEIGALSQCVRLNNHKGFHRTYYNEEIHEWDNFADCDQWVTMVDSETLRFYCELSGPHKIHRSKVFKRNIAEGQITVFWE